MNLDYILADPTGNITVLIRSSYHDSSERARMISEAFSLEPSCEQAGFIMTEGPGRISLEMMGYELCGNAVLSAASWQAYSDGLGTGAAASVTVNSSGADDPLEVSVTRLNDISANGRRFPAFRSSVLMPEPSLSSYKDHPLVTMSGIAHLIIPASSCSPAQAKSLIRSYAEDLQIPALGMILCSGQTDHSVKIRPLVYVQKSETMVWEHGCATGSTAVGYYLFSTGRSHDSVDVIQPGGIINIARHGSDLLLSGQVILHV